MPKLCFLLLRANVNRCDHTVTSNAYLKEKHATRASHYDNANVSHSQLFEVICLEWNHQRDTKETWGFPLVPSELTAV